MPRLPDLLRPGVAIGLFKRRYPALPHLVLPLSDGDWASGTVRENIVGFEEHAGKLVDEATANDARRPPIFVSHYAGTDFNAVACSWEGSFLILPSSMCWVCLARVFNALLSLPDFMPNIGAAGAETMPDVPEAGLDPAAVRLADLAIPVREPNDPVRRRAADALATAAFELLVLHELGHIRNGHLACVKGNYGLTELAPVDAFDMASLTSHTLEMDADSHATIHAMNRQFSFWEQLAAGRLPDPATTDGAMLLGLYGSQERTLRTCLITSYVLFRFLGPAKWTPDTLWSNRHPPAVLRPQMMLSVVRALLQRAGFTALAEQSLVNLSVECTLEIELAFCRLFWRRSDVLSWMEPALQASGPYVGLLNEEWARLHPLLDANKLGGKLAPVQPTPY